MAFSKPHQKSNRLAAPSQILAVPSQDKTILLPKSATILKTAASKNSPDGSGGESLAAESREV